MSLEHELITVFDCLCTRRALVQIGKTQMACKLAITQFRKRKYKAMDSSYMRCDSKDGENTNEDEFL